LFVDFLAVLGFKIQGLSLARHVLYHLSHPFPTPSQEPVFITLRKQKVLISLGVLFSLTLLVSFALLPYRKQDDGCLVVFNFNSFGNTAKACSTSFVAGTQCSRQNITRSFGHLSNKPNSKLTGY
jgi:hypothetical protein